jgi:TonB-linked SusC/RagA family outer membrane protein
MKQSLFSSLKGKTCLLIILFSIYNVVAYAQQLTITGKVTDTQKQPVPGVSIQIKGAQGGTTTDPQGNFSIKATKGQILVVRSVGFNTQEVPIADNPVINVSLAESSSGLNEVVVIGYGTQKKANVSSAQSSFKADKLEERPIARLDQALVGQMAGVNVRQTTGVPGRAFSVQVRGSGSISGGNEPLYVIDGFPLSQAAPGSNGGYSAGNPLDNINPNDIEDIQVLKDAAAAAIYGSRGSNGVVLITTKRGKTGKPSISLNTYTGFQQASKKLKMLSGPEWIDRATEMINGQYASTFAAQGANASDDYETRRQKYNSAPANINNPLQPGRYVANFFLDPRWSQPGYPGLQFIDWQDAIERSGITQNHQISASGGTEAVKYFVSGNFTDQQGFVKFVDYRAYSARANIEVSAAKNLRFGVNIAPTYAIINDPGIEGKDAIFHQSLSMSPVQEASAGLFPNIQQNGQYMWSNTLNSPLGKLTYWKGTTKRYRTLGTIYGEWEIIKGLTLRSSVNLDNTDNNANTYVPYYATGTLASRTFNATSNPNVNIGTSGTYNSFRRQTFVNENTLTYNTSLNKLHDFNFLLGQSYNVDRIDRATLSSNGGFRVSDIETLNQATGVTGNTTGTKSVLISYFGRAQYSFKNRYLLSASLRTDGSSRFGTNTKFGIFPSASLGWRVSDESFFKAITAISDFKLRATLGVTGANNITDYGSIATLGNSSYVFGTSQANGLAPGNLANPDIRWERAVTYDLGFDFGLFANRITGSFDYYNRLNTQLLLNVQTPGITGFQSYLTNAGSVRNVGQELELTSRNLTGKLQWTTNLNITHNTNKVVSLAANQTQIVIPSAFGDPFSILKVGESINSIFVVKQIGILSQEDIANRVALSGNQTAGDPKYEDLNSDGVIDVKDRQIVGQPNPKYTWGITNTFKYGAFDLSFLIQGQNGGNVYSLLGRAMLYR